MTIDYTRDFIAVDDDGFGTGGTDDTHPLGGAIVRAVDSNRAKVDAAASHCATEYHDRSGGLPRPVLAADAADAPTRWYALFVPDQVDSATVTIVANVAAPTDSGGDVHNDDELEIGMVGTERRVIFSGSPSGNELSLQDAEDQSLSIIEFDIDPGREWVRLYVQSRGHTELGSTTGVDLSTHRRWLEYATTNDESEGHRLQLRIESGIEDIADESMVTDLHALRGADQTDTAIARATQTAQVIRDQVTDSLNTVDVTYIEPPRAHIESIDVEVTRQAGEGRVPNHPRRSDAPTDAATSARQVGRRATARHGHAQIIAHGARFDDYPPTVDWSTHHDASESEPTLAPTIDYNRVSSDIRLSRAVRIDPNADRLRVALLMVARAADRSIQGDPDVEPPLQVELIDDSRTTQTTVGPGDLAPTVDGRLGSDEPDARMDASGLTMAEGGWHYREGQWSGEGAPVSRAKDVTIPPDTFTRGDLAFVDLVFPASTESFDRRVLLSVVGFTVWEIWT